MSNAGVGSNSGSGSSRLCCWGCWGSETYVTPAWWSLLVSLSWVAWICSFFDPAEYRDHATTSSCSCSIVLQQVTARATVSQAASDSYIHPALTNCRTACSFDRSCCSTVQHATTAL